VFVYYCLVTEGFCWCTICALCVLLSCINDNVHVLKVFHEQINYYYYYYYYQYLSFRAVVILFLRKICRCQIESMLL